MIDSFFSREVWKTTMWRCIVWLFRCSQDLCSMRAVLFGVEIYVQWLSKRSKFAIFLHYYCNSFALMIRVTVLPFLWLRMVTRKPNHEAELYFLQNCQVSCLVTTAIKHLTSFTLEIYIWKITWSNEEPSKFCEARRKTVPEVEAFLSKKV